MTANPSSSVGPTPAVDVCVKKHRSELLGSSSKRVVEDRLSKESRTREFADSARAQALRILSNMGFGWAKRTFRFIWTSRKARRIRASITRRSLRKRLKLLQIRSRSALASGANAPSRSAWIKTSALLTPRYRLLEPRMVFDGAVATTANQVAGDTQAPTSTQSDAQPTDAEQVRDTSHELDVIAAAPTSSTYEESSHAIVFIDSSVRDSDIIASAIPSGAEVVFLDKDKDGIEQIAAVMSTRSDVSAIHIVSHGASGLLYLGDAAVSEASIATDYADELALIGQALTENGDILLYGCDVASGERGAAFIEALAQATGTDVAASSNATGATDLGGDWSLEVQSGLIEVQSISAVNWGHLLAPIAITNVDGTSVTATTLANNIAGSGVSVISATYTGANSQAGGLLP